MSLENRTAFITGGSKGIGLAIAQRFAGEGANVFILARHKEDLLSAMNGLEEKRISPGQHFGWIKADVTNHSEMMDTCSAFIREHGAPDYLVNCAGVAHPGRFIDLDLDIFYWMMDVNYFGTVITCKAFAPAMVERGAGHIINVSSLGGVIGIYGYTAYSGSKFAVTGFSDVLRSELKLHGVKVSIVYPPDTETDQLAYESKFKPFITREVASSAKLMKPDDVAKTVLAGIRRNHYVILCNFESRLLYHLQNLLGNSVPAILDWLIRMAIKKEEKLKAQPPTI